MDVSPRGQRPWGRCSEEHRAASTAHPANADPAPLPAKYVVLGRGRPGGVARREPGGRPCATLIPLAASTTTLPLVYDLRPRRPHLYSRPSLADSFPAPLPSLLRQLLQPLPRQLLRTAHTMGISGGTLSGQPVQAPRRLLIKRLSETCWSAASMTSWRCSSGGKRAKNLHASVRPEITSGRVPSPRATNSATTSTVRCWVPADAPARRSPAGTGRQVAHRAES